MQVRPSAIGCLSFTRISKGNFLGYVCFWHEGHLLALYSSYGFRMNEYLGGFFPRVEFDFMFDVKLGLIQNSNNHLYTVNNAV